MNETDWRKLYATNRAAIDAAQRSSRLPTLSPLGVGDEPNLLPPRRPPAAGRPPNPRAWPPVAVQDVQADSPGGTWTAHTYGDGDRARRFYVYTPSNLAAASVPLVVMLHGCTQTPAAFSSATLMNRAAERHGLVVLYPEQGGGDNPQRCWNWFLPPHQARDGGEPAFIAGATRTVIGSTTWNIDPRRVFVVGLSAGGAMAAVMAATYPDLFAALAVHSGLAYGSARTLREAHAALAGGGGDPAAQGRAAHAAMSCFARLVPTIVIHGTADATVRPVNGAQVVEQWMTTNRLASRGTYVADVRTPSTTARGCVEGGHHYARHRWLDCRGRLVQEYLVVEGLGHAWSGGAHSGSYCDPRGPCASEAIWSFFRDVGSR
jgi:poly(hydroxyalkanoate) depolymerase family esterase